MANAVQEFGLAAMSVPTLISWAKSGLPKCSHQMRAHAAPTDPACAWLQILQEALGWMTKAVQEFGLAAMSVPTLISWAKEDLGSPNAAIRTAATQLLATMHRQLGPGLGDLVKPDVKPALWVGIEDAFKSNPQEKVRVCCTATQLLAIMHCQLGPELGDLVKPDVKPAL